MLNNTNEENIVQNNPAIATVVNLGVDFLHLRDTEKIEKPVAEAKPNTKPKREPLLGIPEAIINIPTVATMIATQTLYEIFSLRNKKPSNAVKKGIAAKQSKVIAALVLVIDQMNVIIAKPRPIPPIRPDKPILK